MIELPADTGPALLMILIVGCILGGFVKGLSGSGLPQIAVPMIALVADVPVAVALVQLPAMAINLLQLKPGGGHRMGEVLRHWPIALVLMFSTAIGVSFLKVAPSALLLGIMGVLTLVATVFLKVKPAFVIPPALRLIAGVPLAVGAGVSAGMSSLAGPFIIPYLLSLRLPKDVFVAVISLCYLAAIIPTIFLFLLWDVVKPDLFVISLFAIIPSSLGMWVGSWARSRVEARLFRRIVLLFLMASGFALVVKAATG